MSRWKQARERFREDNRLLVEIAGGWRAKLYLYLAALTLAFQISVRAGSCAEFFPCAVSLSKAVVWAAIWPFYWINYVTDFVLLRPYGPA